MQQRTQDRGVEVHGTLETPSVEFTWPAATFHPDLILLDLGLPGLDGGAVCARLRQEAWGATVVIAAVTGWGQEEDRRRTKISGFDVHLVKPVDPRQVLALVRELPPPRLM